MRVLFDSHRESQVVQNVMDGLSHIRRMEVVVIRISKLGVPILHLRQEAIQSTLMNLK